LKPIAGLEKLENITVWIPLVMLEENGGHGGSSAGGVKNSVKIHCDRLYGFPSESEDFFA